MAAKIKTYQPPRRNKHKPRGISDNSFEKVHWPYIPILLVLVVLLSVGLQSGILQASARNPRAKVLEYATSMSVSGLLSSTNASRAANGVSALTLNSKLNAAAQAKAEDMSAKNYWSHYTPDGSPPWVFVSNQGYSYQKLGENLAAGFSGESATVDGWMASAPHKANMLDGAFSEVGFGYINNPSYTSAGGGPMTIVVAFYGKPTVAAASTPSPPPAAPAKKTPPAPPPAAAQLPTPAPPPAPPELTPSPRPLPPAPATTEAKKEGITLSVRTSRAQIAFAKLPVSSFATGLLTFAMFAAVGFWISRHLLNFKKLFARSESFVIHHPLIDVGLIIITGLSFLLTRTAGFIQ